jgi:hypothetical protein
MQAKFVMAFVASTIVGWILICLLPIEYKTVVVYPTPDNLTKIQYKDKSENCFEFSSSNVQCTHDAKKIEVQ